MYKIKKKTEGKTLIGEIEFIKDKVVNVDEKLFTYITKTFKDMFEVVKKPETKKPKSFTKTNVKGKNKE